MKLKFKRFSGRTCAPIRATLASAGYDLFSAEEVEIVPQILQFIKTGIGLKIPKHHSGRICARSCWAAKFTSVGAGVIDSDFLEIIKLCFLILE